MERCVALPYSSLKSSETHAVNPELCAPPRAVKIMTFFFLTILPERVFCEGSRANLRSILDPTLWASFPGVYPLPPRLRAAASLRDCGSRSRAAVQPRGHGP